MSLFYGDPSVEIVPELGRKEEELIVTKTRVGSFSTTNLRNILNSNGVNHIVLAGVATSGVILTTVREASDMDFKVTVLRDCCQDRSQNVHNVLMDDVFPRQADVKSVEDWTKEN